VGSAVCKACVDAGLPVTSVSRSGAPPGLAAPWTSGVDYKSADVTDGAAMATILAGASAVVSCVGGFGDNAAMLAINGAANEAAVAAASAAGVPRFVFVSVHRYNIPEAITDAIGYFKGKRSAEKAVLGAFGAAGSVLQPGFIYGDRLVGTMTLPLGAVGAPLERALLAAQEGPLAGVLKVLAALPASDALLAPPVAVEAVAAAALRCATGKASGVFDIEGINKLAADKS
jgi:nucleoside-diphosphate-sugar epimerase